VKTAPRDRSARTAWPGTARFAGVACMAMAIAIATGLSACASVGHPSADRQPYAGVFTGDFIDGLPLYRLPSITVVGTRDGVVAD